MNNLSVRFVDRLYNLSNEKLPQKISDKATECFIDYLAVVIGGSNAYAEKNQKFVTTNKCMGECHVFGLNSTVDLRTAVMMNAFTAHVLELDDSHREAMTHLGAPIFSALLGVAEIYNNTLEELLRAAVVGYEAAIRLANAVQPSHKKRGFHVSGTCCTVGCAVAVAAMLKYTREEMGNVFSAAVTSAAGLLAVISGKSEQKPYNIANAAVSGVNAALYGHMFIGALDILGDSRGFLNAFTDEVKTDKLFEEGYAIEGIYQKLYAACRHCHAPLEAALNLSKKEVIDLEKVERIIVKTYDLAIKGHDHTEITGISSAKQSIPFAVTAALLFNDCGQNAFTEERIKTVIDSDILRKIAVEEDPDLTALVPGKRAAVLNIVLCNNEILSERVDFAKGEPENPITDSEWEEKVVALAAKGGISETNALKIVRLIKEEKKCYVNSIFQTLLN